MRPFWPWEDEMGKSLPDGEYIAFLLENGQPTGVAAIMGDDGKWVRWLRPPFFSKAEKGYPIPITFPNRASAVRHMRDVIRHAKRIGVFPSDDVEFGYAIYRVRRTRK